MVESGREARDWCRHAPSCALAWGLPITALVASSSMARGWMPVVWPVALAWMGTACLLNARQCGRLHCYVAGPFFYLMAVVSALHGFGIADLGSSGWSWISGTTLVGGIALTWGQELLLGRYASREQG